MSRWKEVKHWESELKSGDAIAIVWSAEDVRAVHPELSAKQAREVLRIVERQHDAEYGISWVEIANAAQEVQQ